MRAGGAVVKVVLPGAVGSAVSAALGGVANRVEANARGGMVTGITGGRAIVAAPGEGLASVGKGEYILPPRRWRRECRRRHNQCLRLRRPSSNGAGRAD